MTTTPDVERDWWDEHADRIHVWGEEGDDAWTDGIGYCVSILRRLLRVPVREPASPVRVAPLLDERLLDLGSGLGRLSVPMARYGFRIVGVDVSAAMIARARREADLAGVADVCEFIQGDGRTLPPVGSVDGAYSVLLFQHLPEAAVAGYVREVGQVLRPGGGFVVQFVDRPGDVDGFLSHAYRRSWMAEQAYDAGLGLVETYLDRTYPWVWQAFERR